MLFQGRRGYQNLAQSYSDYLTGSRKVAWVCLHQREAFEKNREIRCSVGRVALSVTWRTSSMHTCLPTGLGMTLKSRFACVICTARTRWLQCPRKLAFQRERQRSTQRELGLGGPSLSRAAPYTSGGRVEEEAEKLPFDAMGGRVKAVPCLRFSLLHPWENPCGTLWNYVVYYI